MGEARSLTVMLETVTPLFLGGADPRRAPELRPPSFRGAMRYWLRAALGGVMGDQNLDALRKTEAVVFGSTGGASPIEIRLSSTEFSHQGYNPLPHKTREFQFNGFDPGQSFELTLVGRRANEASWHAAVGALLLTIRLGGLGRRSRRGFGSLCLQQVDLAQAQLPELWQKLLQEAPNSSMVWEQHLKNIFKAAKLGAKGLVKHLELPVMAPASLPSFPFLNTESEIMLCHRVFSDWQEALKAFGQAEHAFRQQNPRAKNALGSADPRWASPLWARVLPVDKGVLLALTILWSQPPRQLRADKGDLRRFVEGCGKEWNGRRLRGREVAQ